ncbi:uncharacterized protein Dmul_04230 [Desulfococcus multivorans]|nr:uncharacterized protein Dmul_04230 [Desulfococcus multivorans]
MIDLLPFFSSPIIFFPKHRLFPYHHMRRYIADSAKPEKEMSSLRYGIRADTQVRPYGDRDVI